ncbi:hypothetical protein Tco_1113286 [Tanacetum coccineum]|uniref:Reverse transcriptase domain-containing protein n=1 Tax=Tanacetum coccineum TaxID=301880 RepID=A0ABQ5IRR1_9ASTR
MVDSASKLMASSSGGVSYHASIKCAPFEALYGQECRSLVIWTKVEESQLIGPELVQETTEKIFQIKERCLSMRSEIDENLRFVEEPIEIVTEILKKAKAKNISH